MTYAEYKAIKPGTKFWALPCREYYESPLDKMIRLTYEDAERDCAECYANGMWYEPWTDADEDFVRKWADSATLDNLRRSRDVCRAEGYVYPWGEPLKPLVPVRLIKCINMEYDLPGFVIDVRECLEGCTKCKEAR